MSRSSNAVLTCEGVSKKYCRSLKRGMLYSGSDILRDVLGLPSMASQVRPGEFWALDDVTFDVKAGECMGLIGANGAGKSTLLKMLNGIITPDRGEIRINGRVGALIEVGAGFHPMLSGRENVYVNGAILGMTRREIDSKYDSIVEFAGLSESVLEAPVKTYSTGMYVRLGFAIAASAEPDILLVDEVLSVGDNSFQLRCRDRIAELRRNGTAIVFVSHALAIVNSIADRAVVIAGGKLGFLGDASEAIGYYVNMTPEVRRTAGDLLGDNYHPLAVLDVRINDQSRIATVPFANTLRLEVDYDAEVHVPDGILNIAFWNTEGIIVGTYTTRLQTDIPRLEIPTGRGTVKCEMQDFRLGPGKYTVGVAISDAEVIANYLCDSLTTLTVGVHSEIDTRSGWWVHECHPTIHPSAVGVPADA